MRIIDTHPHIVSSDRTKYPPTPLGGHQSEWSGERPIGIDGLLAQMDAAGVERSVVVHSSTTYGFDNSYVADAVGRFPQRLAGVVSVNVRAGCGPDLLRCWAGLPGIVGLRIFTAGSTVTGQAFPVDDPQTYPVWETAAALDLPVCVQATYAALPEVAALARRFAPLKIVVDHFAKPDLHAGPPYHDARLLLDLATERNVYLKYTPRVVALSSAGESTPQRFMAHVIERFGSDRIMWGSNYPNNPMSLVESVRKAVDALGDVDDDTAADIFADTAAHVYPALQTA